MRGRIRIGTAGWAIPRAVAERFSSEGSGLARYARQFNAVEINSSFHRPHRPATYARWAASVPPDFRFSVKVPRAITHERRLVETGDLIDRFLTEAAALGEKLGPLLVQLPPSLTFDPAVAEAFFSGLRGRFTGAVTLEPRHASWFEDGVGTMLTAYEVARVAADPVRAAGADVPAGWPGLVYLRLHGSPQPYFSTYPPAYLEELAGRLARYGAPVWCIFDNTGRGGAAANALDIREMIAR